ncbi:TrbI/VirB10 family protein [Chromobacterium haemolyticum]|uniref:TrbI/VirB10 family protein n=1 Tax=Chromobacterium haemolyticum TaxID=394935 RepID=UPI0024475F3F|nr:TrbI/VirB10 family protein [Chromobacterium haemolyticum]MDH0342004.1 hypothetical protein [Chromobacterium haemolyticum]
MAGNDKKSRLANIRAQLGDGSTRIRYFGGLAICLVGALIGYLTFRHSTTIPQGEPSHVPSAPDVAGQRPPDNGMPQATPQYDTLIAKQNASDAAAAKVAGNSTVPVIRTGVEAKPEPAAMAASAPVSETSPKQATSQQTQQNTQDAAATQRYQEELQRRQQAIAARAAAMKSQVNLLISSWMPKDHATVPVRDSGKDAGGGSAGNSVGTGNSTATTQQPSSSAQQTGRTYARGGDVAYAQLETAVNTDEPGPVTATILQGDLKGTKLLGKAEVGQNAQKAGLHFTLANIPGQSSSVAIDAWAIDQQTARTALASDVDNHVLMRYGALFASSFLSGFGDALLKGGQNQQIVAGTTGTVIQTDAYSTKQLLQSGIANVGKTAGSNMASVINRPATITINAGIGMGILFMNDVTVK